MRLLFFNKVAEIRPQNKRAKKEINLPTIFTHALIPIALGKTISTEKKTFRFWLAAALCSIVADADVITFAFGIEYGDFLGHRGFFHSLCFAFILSMVMALWEFRKLQLFSKPWWKIWIFFFCITASHGVLDTFTNGGLGIALFSPFDKARYFAPWTPLIVSPIGARGFFTPWGLAALASEILWIWLPLIIALVIAKTCRKIRNASGN